MATKTEILLNSVKFNKLTRKQYDEAKVAEQINENEFYITGETLDEGDMLKSEYDSIFAGKELILTGESIELKDSSEDRISSIMINGYTVQEGTGDASPENVREIKNASRYNRLVVFDGSSDESWSMQGSFSNTIRFDLSSALPSNVFNATEVVILCNLFAPGVSTTDSDDYEHIRTSSVETAKDTIVVYVAKSRLSEATEAGFKAFLAENHMFVAYKSTENTGKYYTGIAVEQGEDYSCKIVELQAPLHEGDTLETNVQSEYDKVLIINQNSAIIPSGTESIVGTSRRFNVKVMDLPSTPSNIYGKVLCNRLPLKTASETYENDVEGISIQNDQYSQNNIQFRVHECKTEEEIKAWLTDNPLYVVYKSTSGGTGKNVRRETHVKKTLVLTGTEDNLIYVESSNFLAIPTPDVGGDKTADRVIGNVKCSHFKNEWPGSNLIYSQPKNNRIIIVLPSVFNSLATAKTYFAEQLAAGTPVTVEYDLAAPEVYADTPVEIKNPKGTFTISGEKNTSLNVNLKSITDANFLEGRTWNDIEDYVDNKISSSSSSSVTGVKGNAETTYRKGNVNLTPANIGAASISHTHTKSQITDFPTSLKNPNALTLSLNGTSQGAYDGSTAKSINVTPSSIGALGASESAASVQNAFTVKNSAGEQLTSFNGSEAKELTLTKSAVGLSNVDNTTDSAKKVLSASKATGSSFQLGSVNTNAKFFATNDSNLILAYNTATYNHLYLGLYGSAGNALCPNGDSGLRLGTDGAKWSGIWAASGTINTSDAQQKKDIADLEGGAEFIYALRPVSFKFVDGESGRTHWGLTAQNVKAVMDAQGISDTDFAGWTRAPKTERTEDGGFREIPGEYEYGLRYAEFIAPLIAAVQSQKHEIDALRAELDNLKEEKT